MKRLLLSALCAVPAFCFGQTLLYNDGAMVKVQPGATLYVEGGIHNTATGTIDNDGTIEVKGNFLNQGTWENSQPNTLKFSGNVNSDVTPGTAVFHNVIVQKDASFNVNLLGNMTVNNNLDFASAGSSKITLGNFDLTMGAASSVTGHDSDEYVVTGGTGKMKKVYTAAGSFEFPVGFDGSTYNPATLNVTAGPADTYSVRVGASPTDGNGLTGTPLTKDVVNAVWDIQETTPGGNTANVTLAWAETDELIDFADALNAVSRNDGTNGWDGLHADLGPEVANTRTRNGATAFGAFTVGDEAVGNTLLVNAKVLLQGPYITANSLMVDSLRKYDFIPLVEPYATLPTNPYVHKAYGGGESVANFAVFNQPLDADDIVDWVVVELRSLSDSTTVLASTSALLQRDGNIVSLTGTGPVAVQGVADGNYILGVRHRNHLGIRTATSYNLTNVAGGLVDMTSLATVYDDPALGSPTTPMKLLTGSTYGLWAGDVNFSQSIVYNGAGSDRSVILSFVGLTTPTNTVLGYSRTDVNMNATTVYNGAGSDRSIILSNVGLLTPTNVLLSHNQ
jgi:hypothetical protein